jgi:hypothetical protein
MIKVLLTLLHAAKLIQKNELDGNSVLFANIKHLITPDVNSQFTELF